MHYSIIINSQAGNGTAKQAWQHIKSQLDAANVHYDYQLTKEVGDAEYLARRIGHRQRSQSLVMIVVGGDGTLHDVLNGLIRSTPNHADQVPLAYIPIGVNSAFAKGYGISMDPDKALQQILSAHKIRRINIGHYHDAIKDQDQYFLNNLGIGFDAAIISRVNSHSKRQRPLSRFGFFRHALEVLYNQQQAFNLMVQQQGSREFFKKAYIVIIANHPYMSGHLQITPAADLTESSLDLIVAERKNWLVTFWQIWKFTHGKLANSRFASHYHGRSFHCTTTSLEFAQVDGEEIGNQFMDLLITTTIYPFYQQAQN